MINDTIAKSKMCINATIIQKGEYKIVENQGGIMACNGIKMGVVCYLIQKTY